MTRTVTRSSQVRPATCPATSPESKRPCILPSDHRGRHHEAPHPNGLPRHKVLWYNREQPKKESA